IPRQSGQRRLHANLQSAQRDRSGCSTASRVESTSSQALFADDLHSIRLEGLQYRLFFGPDFDWHARVTRCGPDSAFELTITIQETAATCEGWSAACGSRVSTRGAERSTTS